MNESIEEGTRRLIGDTMKVYYEGYWIKYYDPPQDSLAAKKQLIQSLTRRLFNHMEHGINIPGRLLDKVRRAYEMEQDPRKKRVKGAMLAGALFNRAADIFTRLVELEDCGIEIGPEHDLMQACGECLKEALQFGKLVRHRNGDEGIDELWGEPFKAFTMSIANFYETRYVKIAMTMQNIDRVADHMRACVRNDPRFDGLEPLIEDYANKARRKCEILRTDEDLFDVWADFVVAGEEITAFQPIVILPAGAGGDVKDGKILMATGVRLIAYITRARTPMPKSTDSFYQECHRYRSLPL